jgi:hypothetical protein
MLIGSKCFRQLTDLNAADEGMVLGVLKTNEDKLSKLAYHLLVLLFPGQMLSSFL